MQSRLKRFVGTTTLALASLACARMGHTQAVALSYPDALDARVPSVLLNGTNLALYLNGRGDLGAPRTVTGGKPGSKLGPGGIPLINNDGSVQVPTNANPGNNGGTYGALYSQTDTTGSLADSVRAKREYITSPTAFEDFSLRIGPRDSSASNNWVFGNNIGADPTPTISGNSRDGLLSATSILNVQGVQITQKVAFNDPLRKDLAQFTVTFKNNSGADISDLRYARAVGPNLFSGDTGTPQQSSDKALASNNKGAFLINASINDSTVTGTGGKRNLGLGVLPGDPNSADGNGNTAGDPTFFHTTILSVAGKDEATILSNPDHYVGLGSGFSNYITLDDVNGGSTFVDNTGSLLDPGTKFVSDDFAKFLANPADPAHQYLDTDFGIPEDPFFTGGTDSSMLLLSPELSLANGESKSWTFYYFFDPAEHNITVPEPGAMAMLAGAFVTGSGFLLRRRRASKR